MEVVGMDNHGIGLGPKKIVDMKRVIEGIFGGASRNEDFNTMVGTSKLNKAN